MFASATVESPTSSNIIPWRSVWSNWWIGEALYQCTRKPFHLLFMNALFHWKAGKLFYSMSIIFFRCRRPRKSSIGCCECDCHRKTLSRWVKDGINRRCRCVEQRKNAGHWPILHAKITANSTINRLLQTDLEGFRRRRTVLRTLLLSSKRNSTALGS